ncbi:MAG: Asp-tRNA(Asn)/Glu-tRNA(Gln) amidotransferase GatCAB subunit C, partial [Candidatus Nealsonbacteria bacterium CG01_land_8_20_14_3_00_12]
MLINKKTLGYLAELSRIELNKESEEKLLKDLQKILAYFEELKEVDIENIEPMAGGTI